MEHPWSRGQIAAALADPRARVRLAFANRETGGAEPIGFVVARQSAHLLEIDLVGVDSFHRRTGVARWLLTELIETAFAAGVDEVQLELAASNKPAHALYEALGFVVVGRRSRYYPDGEDASLLTRKLE